MYRIDPVSGEPDFTTPTAFAALRALSTTVTQLHAHMQSSQQQQRLPVVYKPVMSDIERLSAALEAKASAEEGVGIEGRTDREKSMLNGLVKAFKSSFRRRESKGSPDQKQGLQAKSASQELREDLPESSRSSQRTENGTESRRQSALGRAWTEVVSSREGEQCLLKALLQLEGMRVLENCLTACLHVNFSRDGWGLRSGIIGES